MKKIGQKIVDLTNQSDVLSGKKGIHKIGIQALPGTTFTLENHNFIMGKTGIFEVEDNNITFTSLSFNDISNQKILVDYIYEVQEGE